MTPKLFVALPCYGDMPAVFVRCLASLIQNPPCSLQVKLAIGDSLVSRARNSLSADFLASDCTHLLFIDTDLIFSSEHIARLLSHEVPLVGGFYPKKQDGDLAWVCNALIENHPPETERGLQELRYIGTGFMLVAREVFERMIDDREARFMPSAIAYKADQTGRDEHDFWRVGVYQGRYLSEDWFFCQRALDLGYKVYGDTRVILKHWGSAAYPLKSQEAMIAGAYLNVCPADMKPHIRKIFLGEYNVPGIDPPKLILDIGANIGGFSTWAARKWESAKIVALEPHPGNAAMFEMNTREFADRINLIRRGVLVEAGEALLIDPETNCGAHSFCYPNGEGRVVDCMAARELPPADFIKIDTEGCELEILRELDLTRCQALALEYHRESDRADIPAFLEWRFKEVSHEQGTVPDRGVLKFVVA
jgi:FkbM family methyltransferase